MPGHGRYPAGEEGITRRGFLKALGTAVGALALGGPSGCSGYKLKLVKEKDVPQERDVDASEHRRVKPLCEIQKLEFSNYRDMLAGNVFEVTPTKLYSELPKDMEIIVFKYPRAGRFAENDDVLGIYFGKTKDRRTFVANPRYGSFNLTDIVLEPFKEILREKGHNVSKMGQREIIKVLEKEYDLHQIEERKTMQILQDMEKSYKRHFNDIQIVGIKCTTKGKYPTFKDILNQSNILGTVICEYADKDLSLTKLTDCKYSIYVKTSPGAAGGTSDGAAAATGTGGAGGGSGAK